MNYELIINGCSFTKYLWPTWADFLCFDFDTRMNIGNWAMGNEYIFYTTYPYIKNANTKTKFIINWAFYSKFDNKKDGIWDTLGNVANAEHKPKNIRDHYYYFYDDDYWFEKTETIINAVTDLLEGKNLSYWYTSARNFSKDIRSRSLENIYKSSNFIIDDLYSIGINDPFSHSWKNGRFKIRDQKDWHPRCELQLDIAKTISKKTNIPLTNRYDLSLIALDIDNRIKKISDFRKLAESPINLEEYS